MKNELIKKLENDFLENHNQMDKCNEMNNSNYAQRYAMLCCYICQVLGVINGTGEEEEMERLYNKYNLWKRGE